MLPIRKCRESLRDLRRVEVEGAMVVGGCGGDVVVLVLEMRRWFGLACECECLKLEEALGLGVVLVGRSCSYYCCTHVHTRRHPVRA